MIERSEWLSSLKVGDEVWIQQGWHKKVIITITKITPTRKFRCSNGNLYNKSGSTGSDTWSYHSINKITPKIREEIVRRKLSDKIQYEIKTKLLKMDIESMKKIIEIMDEW